jgi:hypothetical protein
VIHSGTKTIQALKFTRPSTEPMNRIGVIAANTNWKYSTEEAGNLNPVLRISPVLDAAYPGIAGSTSGIVAWPSSALAPRMVRGSPIHLPTSGVPKPILKPHSTQTMRTRAKVTKTMSVVFIAHFFCTRPP